MHNTLAMKGIKFVHDHLSIYLLIHMLKGALAWLKNIQHCDKIIFFAFVKHIYKYIAI